MGRPLRPRSARRPEPGASASHGERSGAIDLEAVPRTSSLLLVLTVLAGPARAQPAREVEVVVGHTTRVDVGFAIGLNCDDPDLVEAKLVTAKDKKRNDLVLKGLAPGDTHCRAGTGLGATVLVHIVVTEPER